MNFHPAADIFPLLQGEEYEALKADISKHGQLEPIWTYHGEILDGRNRYRACQDLSIAPASREYTGSNPVEFVWSLNAARRQLTATQKAAAAVAMLPLLEAEAKERQAQNALNNRPQNVEKIPLSETGKSREKAAALAGVNERYISDAKKIQQADPVMFEQMRSGQKELQQAKRELRERTREERRQDNREKVASVAAPATETGAKFATILIDPPWDWSDEGDINQLGRAKPDYATMTLPELRSLPVTELADDDCHLYLWITNRSLPKGFSLMEFWGFRYITCITWVKPSFGMGNYFRGQTEHLLFGVRGSQPLKRKDAATVFNANRGPGGHSSKPDEAYALIESCSPGPYLEMFSRRGRADWTAWGESGVSTVAA